MPCIMPERLARTDPTRSVAEMVGSGPFRFLADEYDPGARATYARFDAYVPRPEPAELTAGGKVAHFARVEWRFIPEIAAAAAALRAGEVDWWGNVPQDLEGTLGPSCRTSVLDPLGQVAILRFNHLHPPFDRPAIRRVVLASVSQAAFMRGLAPEGRWNGRVGAFCPGTPLATDADPGTGDAWDPARAAQALREAGYAGERVVLLDTADMPDVHLLCQVAADLLRRIGMNLDLQVMDVPTFLSRRASTEPVDRGGWSVFVTRFAAADFVDPAGHLPLRGNGRAAWFGWPDMPEMEQLRDRWFATPDLPTQQAVARAMQAVLWRDVPYVPLGRYQEVTAFRLGLTGMLSGFPMFHNIRRV